MAGRRFAKGTKRKRSDASKRPAKKARISAKKSKAIARVNRGGNPAFFRKLPFFRSLAPRIYTTHKNHITIAIATTAPGFTNTVARALRYGQLRDMDAYVTQKQPYPENFVLMSSLYRRYRVNAIEVTISMSGLTNNENDKFWLCVYTTPDRVGAVDPYPVGTIADRATRDAFLQEPQIRRRLIASSGTTGNRMDGFFKAGRFSLSMGERERRGDMDDDQYSGQVNADGTAVSDPTKSPNLWFRIVSQNAGGFPDAEAYSLNLSIKSHVEWYDRRKTIETDQGETG